MNYGIRVRRFIIITTVVALSSVFLCACKKTIVPDAVLDSALTESTTSEEASADNTAFENATDFVVLSTTDMHGRCWDTNILTGYEQKNNMLRVSTAVNTLREEYGRENCLLIDNGDLYQGTQLSEEQIMMATRGESSEPLAMSVCIAEIGYDALVLGNHEFNFPWKTMKETYNWLEKENVPVLAANIYYDGSVDGQVRGENAFHTYIVKNVTVNGHEHKIGILGLENPEITRWDQPSNYPGLIFASPDNPEHNMAKEVMHYIPQMRDDGCELIIVSFHSGFGKPEDPEAREKMDNQGGRLVQETEGIDLLILGHDHNNAYSNSFVEDASGRKVPVVNGGCTDITKSVFRLAEDSSGELKAELVESVNLAIEQFDVDATLEEKMRPYAEIATNKVETPVGIITEDWDASGEFYTAQSNNMDLVCAAMMESATRELKNKYDGDVANVTAENATGLDHLDVDLAMTTVTSSGYTLKSGEVSMKDIYRFCRYSNTMDVIPMTGSQIKTVMEENAEKHLKARPVNGKVTFYSTGHVFTNIVFGGLNFKYDMSKPVGSRVIIDGFSNGREFKDDGLYLVAASNYILGHEEAGMRSFHEEDAIWFQTENEGTGQIQDLIVQYIKDMTEENQGVSSELFPWSWKLVYSAGPDHENNYSGKTVAQFAKDPEDGHKYIIYQEADGVAIGEADSNAEGTLKSVNISAYGDYLVDEIPEGTRIFTAHKNSDGTFSFSDQDGHYLSCGAGGGLYLSSTELPDGDLGLWQMEESKGGWNLINAGADDSLAIELYYDAFNTYHRGKGEVFVVNFYEVS